MPKTRSTSRRDAATALPVPPSPTPNDTEIVLSLRRSTRLRASIKPYSPYTFSGRRMAAPRPGERPNARARILSTDTTPEVGAEPAQVQFLLRTCARCRKRIVYDEGTPPSRKAEKQLRDEHRAEFVA